MVAVHCEVILTYSSYTGTVLAYTCVTGQPNVLNGVSSGERHAGRATESLTHAVHVQQHGCTGRAS